MTHKTTETRRTIKSRGKYELTRQRKRLLDNDEARENLYLWWQDHAEHRHTGKTDRHHQGRRVSFTDKQSEEKEK